jgi:hypothetical protein
VTRKGSRTKCLLCAVGIKRKLIDGKLWHLWGTGEPRSICRDPSGPHQETEKRK